jgi:hypothetical protein
MNSRENCKLKIWTCPGSQKNVTGYGKKDDFSGDSSCERRNGAQGEITEIRCILRPANLDLVQL